MIPIEPYCNKKNCQHFLGWKIILDDGLYNPIVTYCKAFPEGIPKDIYVGKNLHLIPLHNQKNDLVFLPPINEPKLE